jgi:hypothetical protein
MADVASETNRRFELWKTLSKERLDDIEPARLRGIKPAQPAQRWDQMVQPWRFSILVAIMLTIFLMTG